MSIQTPLPKVTKITTVSNVSTTSRFPVERSSSATAAPQTRPPGTPRPTPPLIPKDQQGTAGISKAPTPLRASLEAMAARPPGQRSVPVRIMRPPIHTGGINDPPEGVGPGSVPRGGVKVR
ncbi:MAG TPA: hypothetical protein VFC35_03885 [Gemmatimonadaceae bacterium]|nr:hypothetical protein [Gemmatimonadaceae bacterium]